MESPAPRPEARFSSDPLRDLLIIIQGSFKDAFAFRSSREKAADRHPTSRVPGHKSGRFIKRDSVGVNALTGFKIMLKLPEIDPESHYDDAPEIAETLDRSGMDITTLADTQVMVYMVSANKFDRPDITDDEISDEIDKIEQFIVHFHNEESDAYYVVDVNGIWPMAPSDSKGVDIEKEFEELLAAEAEGADVDSVVEKINRQNELAQNWVYLFGKLHVVAFQ